jgi:hypothetical protein
MRVHGYLLCTHGTITNAVTLFVPGDPARHLARYRCIQQHAAQSLEMTHTHTRARCISSASDTRTHAPHGLSTHLQFGVQDLPVARHRRIRAVHQRHPQGVQVRQKMLRKRGRGQLRHFEVEDRSPPPRAPWLQVLAQTWRVFAVSEACGAKMGFIRCCRYPAKRCCLILRKGVILSRQHPILR